MINSVDGIGSAAANVNFTAAALPGDRKGKFDVALEAAQRAAARQAERDADFKSIGEKGFSNWARDTQVEALRQKLREKVMKAMGLSEDDLARMPSAMRDLVMKTIEAELTRQMDQSLGERQTQAGDKASGDDKGKVESGKNDRGATDKAGANPLLVAQEQASKPDTGQNLHGKNDREEKTAPVIPALVWPGAASVL